MSNKISVLVTGGSGFVGSYLVERLIKTGFFVINIDKLDYCSQNNTKNLKNTYKFIHGNIMNKELISFILNEYKINVVFHLAAQSSVDNSFNNSILFSYDNIIGTHIILECIREYNDIKIKEENDNLFIKLIYMSTDEVYGDNKNKNNIFTENSLLNPTNPYSATKASAEMLINSYIKSFKLPIIIIRCNNIFGPKQFPEKVIPAFIHNLLNDEKCYIHGQGDNIRHFIYIDNVIDAIIKINEKGKINETYNISTDESLNIKDLSLLLIKKIKNTDNYEEYIEYIENRNYNDTNYSTNCDKLKNLGWEIKINFEEGLKRTIQSFKKLQK